MIVSHAQTLARVRGYVAALADQATSHEASSAYEHVLILLDSIHGDDSPALESPEATGDQGSLFTATTSAIEDLGSDAVDALAIELVLAMLDDARAADRV